MSDNRRDLSTVIASGGVGDIDTDIDLNDLSGQIRLNELKNERFRSNTQDRKNLATWTSIVVSVWLLLVMVILFQNKCCLFLSDTVLVALLGTTTLNVLGLSFIVLKGYFQSEGDDR